MPGAARCSSNRLASAKAWMALAGALLALASPDVRADSTLRIARIEDIPDQVVGAEILKAVYARLGVKLVLVDLPAARALAESSAGRLDGEVQRYARVAQQHPSLLLVRPSINRIEPSVFSKRHRFAVTGPQALARYRIAIVRGVGTSEDLTRGLANVQAVAALEQAMELLAGDRVDVVVCDRFSGLVVLRRLRLEGIRALDPPLERTETFHFLHEKHRPLVAKVEHVLQEMQASGELHALRDAAIERYLVEVR